MKKIFLVIGAAAIMAATTFNICLINSRCELSLSDLALANVIALAQSEDPNYNDCHTGGYWYCGEVIIYPDNYYEPPVVFTVYTRTW